MPTGQRTWPVPRHHPDRNTQPGQVRSEGVLDLAGPEHDMQPGLSHDQVLPLTPSHPDGRRQPSLGVCHGRYAGFRKQAISF